MNIKEQENIDLNRSVQLEPQKLIRKKYIVNKEKLKIVYIMVWTQVCGGSKIILEYANRISQKGHDVTIITYDQKPEWFKLNEQINFIQVPKNEELKKYIPKCDLIVATSWKCIYSAIDSQKAPVVFFEQGGAHIFETDKIDTLKKEIVQNRLDLVPYVYTVSSYTKDMMKENYNKECSVITNAVDDKIFYPRENDNSSDVVEITIIGSEDFKFKNIEGILIAIRKLKQKYSNINLNWITQTKPQKNKEAAIINPEQKVIGDILRKTDIYICNSEYESFGLPTLEAMTCGAAVITTDTGGMRDFVIENKNALIIEKNNVQDMIQKIETLIKNKELRKQISQEGMKTAQKFNWENSVNDTLKYYADIAEFEIDNGGN